ncbi:MAG: universal stress protein [Deltaproteobacteria bacterium]|nr:MAG: universal stress protein [Deltaproteobacteria bacterium]
MSEIKKILACVDLSQFSGAVLDYAAEAAWREDAEILVYNIINQRDIDHVEDVRNYYFLGSPGKNITTTQYIEKETERRSDELKKLIEKHLGQVNARITTQIDTGHPHKSILKTAQATETDLIVMGNKGRGNLADTFLGSTALRVLRKSPIPVLNVR